MRALATTFLVVLAATMTPGHAARPRADLEFDAFTRPFRLVNLGARVDGLIRAVRVDRGDEVAAGDVVTELEFSVEAANAELARAKAEEVSAVGIAEVQVEHEARRLKQHQSLFDRGLVSIEEYEEVRTKARLAELALQQAREKKREAELEHQRSLATLERGVVRSPIDGVVVERYLAAGEIVSKSTQPTIVQIAQLDPLRLEVIAPVDDYGRLQGRKRAEVDVQFPVPTTLEAHVVAVDRVFDAASRTFRLDLEVANPGLLIPAGMRCRVRFDP